MVERIMNWRKKVPQELAQFALPTLPDALQWPRYISRPDLFATEGPRGVVEQLYQQLRKLNLTYEEASFTPLAANVQLIRTPAEILDRRVGTCIDLTLLMAGMCLAAELIPLVIVLDGHALLAVSLTAARDQAHQLPQLRAFEDGLVRDLATFQEWVDEEYYLLVESTGLAANRVSLSANVPEGQGRDSKGYMTFDRACEAGQEQISAQHAVSKGVIPGNGQRTFLYAVHVHDLQLHGFPPLQTEPAQTAYKQTGKTNFGHVGSIGTFIDGDNVAGDKVTGDKIMGNKIGTINRSSLIEFNNAQTGDIRIGDVAGGSIIKTHITSDQGQQLTVVQSAFALIYQQIEREPLNPVLYPIVADQVRRIEAEAAKGTSYDQELVSKLLDAINALAPGIRIAVMSALTRLGLDN